MKRAATLAVLAAAAVVPWAQARVDRTLGAGRAQAEALYLWNGGQVRRLVPGFELLAADVYWLRTVQYFGSERLFSADKRYELLYPLIEITTTLDPRMEIAYRYGAVFLAERHPAGAGRPDLGLHILERGVRNLPASWRLRQELGFFHFVYRNDPARAAEVLLQAAEIPGSAFWLRSMAADILAEGGHRQISRRMWTEMLAQAEGQMKENARMHLAALDAADAADAVTAAARRFRERRGRPPAHLAELAASGIARVPLVDGAGVPFDYDAGTGRAFVSPRSYLYRPDIVGE